LFRPTGNEGSEGLAQHAAEAIRATLDDRLAQDRACAMPEPTQAGRRHLAAQAKRLIDAFGARGAVIEERRRRDCLRRRVGDSIAALTGAVALDPDLVSLAVARLDRIFDVSAALYAEAEYGVLVERSRQQLGEAAASTLLATDPVVSATRLGKAPFPALIGDVRSAQLAGLARDLAAAAAEDSEFARREAEATLALKIRADALVTVLWSESHYSCATER
jgi:hypothetical protein